MSHAWALVFVPDIGWMDIDPTNDRFFSDRYVTTAHGRDYGGVSPLKGVIYTENFGTGPGTFFRGTEPGWPRVAAVCDWVHDARQSCRR